MRLIISTYFLLFATLTWGQNNISFNLNAEKNKVELGEQINVQLNIDFPAELSNQQIILPLITDSSKLGKGIEIWETSPVIDTLIENNNSEFYKHIEQAFTIATFDTGMVDINPLASVFNGDTVFSNAITLTIQNEPLAPEAELKTIKPIEEDPFTTWEKILLWIKQNWIIITVILLLPIIALIIYFVLKNKPQKIEIKKVIPLNVRILSQLEQIEQEKLWQKGEYKVYHSKITGVLWDYLSERYNIATYEKTSDEILEQLKFKAIDSNHYSQLQQLMEVADLVKFAKTIPTPLENESALTTTRDFIHATYEATSTTIEN